VASNPAHLRYLADAVSTASPAQRVVMLYDRLLLDLNRADAASAAGDRAAVSENLRHGQLIIAELRASLRMEAWAGGENLASLYGYLLGELIALNGEPATERFAAAREIITGLRDSWQAAAASTTAATRTPADDEPRLAGAAAAWVG
jgi:flagellar secretion chaperone FliS